MGKKALEELARLMDYSAATLRALEPKPKRKYTKANNDTLVKGIENRMGALRPEVKRRPGRQVGSRNKPKPQGPT
jgi:hypothetical protein